MIQTRSLTVAFCLLCFGGLARANSFEDEAGMGPVVQSMGGAGTALSSDYSAVYYNPARLRRCVGQQISAGYDYAQYHLRVNDTDPYPKKERLRPLNRYSIGVCAQLPFGLAVGLTFAQGLDHPAFFSQTTTDPKPRFVRYGQRLESLTAMAALAYEITEHIRVGAGVSLLVDSGAEVGTSLSLFEDESPTPFSYGWEFGRSLAAHIGVDVEPLDGLSLGVVYRSSLSHRLSGTVQAGLRADLLGVEGDVSLLVSGVSWFTPHQVALGASYKFGEGWTVATDLTWYHWSEYLGPFVSLELEVDSALRGIADLAPVAAVPANFSDIVVPRFGASYDHPFGWSARAGYSFRPTPAPEPTGVGNVLDADSHQFTLGGGYRLDLGILGEEGEGRGLHLDGVLTVVAMPNRGVDKGAAEAVLNTYTFGGVYFTLGVALSAEF